MNIMHSLAFMLSARFDKRLKVTKYLNFNEYINIWYSMFFHQFFVIPTHFAQQSRFSVYRNCFNTSDVIFYLLSENVLFIIHVAPSHVNEKLIFGLV